MGLIKTMAERMRAIAGLSDEALRDQLFLSVRTSDQAGMASLYDRHAGRIEELFPRWQKAPVAIQNDRQELESYGRCLLAIAEYFRERGRPGLLARLMGENEGGPPLDEIDARLKQADDLRAERRFAEQATCLEHTLTSLEALGGPLAADLRAKTLGALGQAQLEIGDFGAARQSTERALRQCAENSDAEGVDVYTKNLAYLDVLTAKPHPSRAKLVLAQRLSDRGRFAQSNRLIDDILASGEDLAGDQWVNRGKLLGLKGLNLARLADHEAAKSATHDAIAACAAAGDRRGEEIYRMNVATIEEMAAARLAAAGPT